MLHLRWFDKEPDDVSGPFDWRFAALISAALFLNFPFWIVHASDLPMSCSLPLYAGRVGVVALLITALFFVGPALSVQASKRSFFGIIENSFGSAPTYGLRACCVSFLLVWMAKLIAYSGLWLSHVTPTQEVSAIKPGLTSIGLMLFLVFTGLQSLQTGAKQAAFTNKLGLAILLAALIRVRHGWPEAINGSPIFGGHSGGLDLWQGLSQLAFYVGPLAFLAANLGYRSQRRKPVVMIAVMGMAVPLSGTLLLMGIIGAATLKSGLYKPSLEPNVAMALWSHAVSSSLPGRIVLAVITAFGAVRFGVRSLRESASINTLRSWRAVALIGCLTGAVAWFSADLFNPSLDKSVELLTSILALTAAVLTADFFTRSWRIDYVREFDWIGVSALAAGLAAPYYLPPWTVGAAGWLLQSYAIGFLICLLGRTFQQIRRKIA